MRIDQSPNSERQRASENSGLAPDKLDIIAFVVRGQDYLLVKYHDWLRDQETRPRIPQADRPVVGRITINGERHVIIESGVSPPVGDDLPKLELGELLTQRELQVALLVAEGNCDKQIARTLGISGYTVREHIRRTFAKLNVSRRAAIVAHVLKYMRKPIASLGRDSD